MEEIWKDVEGYEGFYQVSNLGRVRSIDHKVKTKGGTTRLSPGRILAQKLTKNGRYQVNLSKDNENHWTSVHRLVAKAFCPGWNKEFVVNHKDENPLNNHADNLEWCTQSYNCKYGHRNDTMVEQRSLEVVMMSEDGSTIREFPSLREAARASGVSAAHICQVCKGERKKAGGYRWKYKE